MAMMETEEARREAGPAGSEELVQPRREFEEYQNKAALTAKYPGRGENPLYPALGLGGESDEFAGQVLAAFVEDDGWIRPERADACAKELGDVAWYASALCDEFGWMLAEVERESRCWVTPVAVSEPRLVALVLCAQAGRILEHAKKAMRDDGGAYTDERRHAIRLHLASLLAVWYRCCEVIGVDWRSVLTRNIAKLLSRMDRGQLFGSGDNR